LAIDEKYLASPGLDVELTRFLGASNDVNALNAEKNNMVLSFGTSPPLTVATEATPIVFNANNLVNRRPSVTKPENAGNFKSGPDRQGETIVKSRLEPAEMVFPGGVFRADLEPDHDVELIAFRQPTNPLETAKSGKVHHLSQTLNLDPHPQLTGDPHVNGVVNRWII
jgi:NitT/TauT family transport system substrate-binding protein